MSRELILRDWCEKFSRQQFSNSMCVYTRSNFIEANNSLIIKRYCTSPFWNIPGLIDDAKRFNSINYKQQFQRAKNSRKYFKKINVRRRKNYFALSLLCATRCSMNDAIFFLFPSFSLANAAEILHKKWLFIQLKLISIWKHFDWVDLIAFLLGSFAKLACKQRWLLKLGAGRVKTDTVVFSTFFQLFIKHNFSVINTPTCFQ